MSTHLGPRAPLVVVLALLTMALFASCEDENDTRPATFAASCDSDADCAPPFSCLDTAIGHRCTKNCGRTDDCPAWHETGHCSGDRRAQCVAGICEPLGCK